LQYPAPRAASPGKPEQQCQSPCTMMASQIPQTTASAILMNAVASEHSDYQMHRSCSISNSH
jgi:hypothetical protein